ncbi:MAG: DUF4265 domain-containing protein [Planctomycetes bacterium]|nr:DUF4265 domain-containing protein [Planctomycetota bacterium]
MKPREHGTVNLSFPLDVQDGWPPVAVECLPFKTEDAGVRLLVAPLFVRGLSVGDVLECTIESDTEHVTAWRHVTKSDHSTFWLLRAGDERVLLDGLERLRSIGCSTVGVAQLGVFAVDVPGEVSMDTVDSILDSLVERGFPVACPSSRHPE